MNGNLLDHIPPNLRIVANMLAASSNLQKAISLGDLPATASRRTDAAVILAHDAASLCAITQGKSPTDQNLFCLTATKYYERITRGVSTEDIPEAIRTAHQAVQNGFTMGALTCFGGFADYLITELNTFQRDTIKEHPLGVGRYAYLYGIAEAIAETGCEPKYKEALRILASAQKESHETSGISLDTRLLIAAFLADRRALSNATLALGRVEEDLRADPATFFNYYDIVADLYRQLGRLEKVTELYSIAKKGLEEIPLAFNATRLSPTITRLHEEGDVENLKTIGERWRAAWEEKGVVDPCDNIIKIGALYVKLGHPEVALKFYESARRVAMRSGESTSARVVYLQQIATEVAAAGYTERSEEIFKEAISVFTKIHFFEGEWLTRLDRALFLSLHALAVHRSGLTKLSQEMFQSALTFAAKATFWKKTAREELMAQIGERMRACGLEELFDDWNARRSIGI